MMSRDGPSQSSIKALFSPDEEIHLSILKLFMTVCSKAMQALNHPPRVI
jgi:hypothetical protein